MKEQVTRKKINLPELFFMKNVKIKTSSDILSIEKCTVTFGFKNTSKTYLQTYMF